MNWLQFWASVIESVAWPLAAVVIVVVLRRPLSHVLDALRKLTVQGLELDFGERVAELSLQADEARIPDVQMSPVAGQASIGDASGRTSELASFQGEVKALAAINPAAAVARAWLEIAQAVRSAMIRLQFDKDVPPQFIRRAMHILHAQGYIDDETYRILVNLSQLRNKAVHPDESSATITYAEALEYARLVERMVQRLNRLDLK